MDGLAAEAVNLACSVGLAGACGGHAISAIVAHIRDVTADPAQLAAAGTEATDLLEEFVRIGDT
jgi:hypothetical protein